MITIEAGFSDSACGGAVVQSATTPGNAFADPVFADPVFEDPAFEDPVFADPVLAGELALATGAGKLAAGDVVTAGDAGVLVRAGEAGAVGVAVFATAVEEAPVPATLVGVAQAETVRASPASAQAANVLCGDSKVFMSSTTDGARGGLR